MSHFAFVYTLFIFVLGACSSLNPHQRRFLDSTSHSDAPPDWVQNTKVTWEDKERVYIRSTHSVRGTERTNGCFDLAKLDSKELLLSELSNEVRGSMDNAHQSISEEAEVVLGKVRSSEFKGRIKGLRFTDQYFERYLIGDTERIDCHILSELKQSDYQSLKRSIIDQLVEVDPKLREAITRKQVDFFSTEKKAQADGPKSQEH